MHDISAAIRCDGAGEEGANRGEGEKGGILKADPALAYLTHDIYQLAGGYPNFHL